MMIIKGIIIVFLHPPNVKRTPIIGASVPFLYSHFVLKSLVSRVIFLLKSLNILTSITQQTLTMGS